MGFPAPPIVSLQHVAAGSARDRHLGWGVLVAADVVLAPAPEKLLASEDDWFEVLLASFPRPTRRVAGDGHRPPRVDLERIAVDRVEVRNLAGGPEGLAVVTLADASRHTPLHTAYDVRAVARSIDAEPGLWRALVVAGVLPDGVLERPLSDLDLVVEAERATRRRRVDEHCHERGGTVAFGFCCVFPWSSCCKARVAGDTPDDVTSAGGEPGV